MQRSSRILSVMTVVGYLISNPLFVAGADQRTAVAAVTPGQPTLNSPEHKFDATPDTELITTPEGREIGRVRDFVVDLSTGRLVYVVAVFHQSKMFHNKLFVLPWGVVTPAPAAEAFVLRTDQAALKSAPSFSLHTWSQLSAAQWMPKVDSYWREKMGQQAITTPQSESALSRASKLVGRTIRDRAGKDWGEVEELIIDSETGQVAYVVVSFAAAGENGEASDRKIYFPVPWIALQKISSEGPCCWQGIA